MEHFSNDHEDCPNQHKNSHNGASCFEFSGKLMETETTALSEFLNGEKGFVE